MLSKLSRYCDGVMEAAWLAAIILAPLFFNTYSSRIFEPDKITLVRTLALLIVAAWSVKLIDEGRLRWEIIELGELKWKTFVRLSTRSCCRSFARDPLLRERLGQAAAAVIRVEYSWSGLTQRALTAYQVALAAKTVP